VPRVVAVGDVHGSYEALLSLLRGTGMVDDALVWAGGRDHLVLIGDLIDRGSADREVLDLVRRLQPEAAQAGGRVHAILGNHEVMNLARDLRYVSPESFAEFAAEETSAERQAGRSRFQSGSTGQQASLRAFMDECPPGYFARMRGFDPDGEYGEWLLDLPVVVKVNGYLFVHGGLTQEVAALGLAEINRQATQGIREFVEHRKAIEDAVSGLPTYAEIADTAERLARGRGERADAARELLRLADSRIFGAEGPLWYRGNSLDNERVGRITLAPVLDQLGARALVVAHTPTGSGRITSRFNGRLIRTDVGMAYGAAPYALVIRDGEVQVFDPATGSFSAPVVEPPQGEGFPGGYEELPDRQLEQFLTRANVIGTTEVFPFVQLVELKRKGLHLRAVFGHEAEASPAGSNSEARSPRRYEHELAAYWLDRRLGLEMVPVAVPRTIDKQPGVLQIFIEDAVDLPFIQDRDAWDLLVGLDAQLERYLVFTALVGARDRADEAKMLLPRQRRIMMSDHARGFPLSTEDDDILARRAAVALPEACGPLEADLEHRLRSLQMEELLSGLGAYLSEAQLDALLVRRDRILEACGGP